MLGEVLMSLDFFGGGELENVGNDAGNVKNKSIKVRKVRKGRKVSVS